MGDSTSDPVSPVKREEDSYESGCPFCVVGPGSGWRLVLYIAGGIILIGLMVYGFASA